MQGNDYLVRAMLGDNQARLFALRTTDVVREAATNHQMTPVAAAALGRALTMGLVLGAMLKGERRFLFRLRAMGP